MRKIKAAVTMRVVKEANYHEIRDSISNDLVHFLHKQNIVPILVPNHSPFISEIIENTDILIISGGNDLLVDHSPKEIEDDPFLSAVRKRNDLELELIKEYVNVSKPIFGICHGLQIINHYFGGSLKRLKSNKVHVNKEHKISIISDTFKDWINLDRLLVNSYHNYVIDNPGHNIEIIALSDDGVIEAIGNKKHKIAAVMWHPERSFSDGVSYKLNLKIISDYMDFIK